MDKNKKEVDLYMVIEPFMGFVMYDKIGFKRMSVMTRLWTWKHDNRAAEVVKIDKENPNLTYISSVTAEEYEYLMKEQPTRIF
jgi:hypothetical protein